MTGKKVTRTVLTCDHQYKRTHMSCADRYLSDRTSVQAARGDAHAAGWRSSNGYDRCPVHARGWKS